MNDRQSMEDLDRAQYLTCRWATSPVQTFGIVGLGNIGRVCGTLQASIAFGIESGRSSRSTRTGESSWDAKEYGVEIVPTLVKNGIGAAYRSENYVSRRHGLSVVQKSTEPHVAMRSEWMSRR